MSMSNTERTKQENKDKLVQKTEVVLRTELSEWIRQMQVTIDKIYTLKEQQRQHKIILLLRVLYISARNLSNLSMKHQDVLFVSI